MCKSLVKTSGEDRNSGGYTWRAGGAAAYRGPQGGLLGKVALARPWRRRPTPEVVGEDLRPEARGLELLGEALSSRAPLAQQPVPGCCLMQEAADVGGWVAGYSL